MDTHFFFIISFLLNEKCRLEMIEISIQLGSD